MALLSLVAIIIIVSILVIGIVSFVRNISAYYRNRFRFSIWSGVFILLFAVALSIIGGQFGVGTAKIIIELIVMLLIVLVLYKDVHRAGIGWGILAGGLQVLFAISLLFMLIVLVVGYFIRKIFCARRCALLPSICMALGMMNERSFLLNFFSS